MAETIIVAITKDKIAASVVDPKNAEKIQDVFEVGWTNETLDLAISEVITKFKTKRVRILVSDALSYVVRLTVPVDVSKEKERNYIWETLLEKIPEELTSAEWDYKEVVLRDEGRTPGSGRDVVVFALPHDFFQKLSEAVEKTALIVSAIEPEAIAKTRNANPIVGLALKEDLSGRDEDVLNLGLTVSQTEADKLETGTLQDSIMAGEGGRFKSKKIILLAIALLLVVNLVVVGYFLVNNIFTKKPKSESKANPTASITPTPTEAPVPTQVELDLTNYKLQIQNGSGKAGEADRLGESLENAGFANIETANAQTFDFSGTSVQRKESVDQAVVSAIAATLGEDYAISILDTFLDSDAAFDIVIIIGR